MTTPADIPVPPQFTDPEFGPDFTSTPETPKVNQKNPPRRSKPLLGLGDNKKPRSGIRMLKDDDKPALAAVYEGVAFAAQFVRPRLAMALNAPGQIDKCVDAWFLLAEKNDRIRRGILAFIEGSGWAAVASAHAPLFMACLPEQFIERFLMAQMNNFFGQSEEDTQGQDYPTYPADLQEPPTR